MDNVYIITSGGTIETVVQVRSGEKEDVPSLVGAHVAEVIHDPFATNHFINQVRRTLTTGWPTEVVIPIRLTDKEALRLTTIEKAGADRVLVFVRPVGSGE